MTQQRQSPPPRDDDPVPAPESAPRPPREPLLGLSLPQVAGGALAASTAAAIGSQLGTAGTVIGAALVSIICAVGGALYARTLQSTGRRMSGLIRRPTAGPTPPDATPLHAEPPRVPPIAAIPDGVPAEPKQVAEEPTGQTGQPGQTGPRRRLATWHYMAAAVAIFALAALTVTLLESLTGKAFSGGQGTTVSRVVSGNGGGVAPSDDQRPTRAPGVPSAEPEIPGNTGPTTYPTPTGRTGAGGSEPGSSGTTTTPRPTAATTPSGETGTRPTRSPSTSTTPGPGRTQSPAPGASSEGGTSRESGSSGGNGSESSGSGQ